MKTFIGLDLGTSNLKGVLISDKGKILAHAIEATHLLRPKPSCVEFDAVEYADKIMDLIRHLGMEAPSDAEVCAIAVSGAAGNTILLDESNRPIQPAISWTDARTVHETKKLIPDIDPESVYPIVGWQFPGTFPLAHLGWFRKHHPKLLDQAAGIGMDIDYVLYRLAGRRGMDYSTATTFYLCNQVDRRWHKPYIDALGIKPRALPQLMESGEVLGTITHEAAKATGLSPDVKVVLGAFDHPSAARGVGVFEPGSALLSCGTSWVGFYPVRDRDTAIAQNLLVDPFRRPRGPWGTMFSFERIGERIEAYISCLCPGENRYTRFDHAASAAPAGAEGLTVDLDAPPESLASYSLENACRAVVEAVAFRIRERVQQLAANGLAAREFTMVGGPATSTVWPQVLADVLGVHINVPADGQHAGAIGAAILAGVGAGIFADDQSGFEEINLSKNIIEPDQQNSAVYEGQFPPTSEPVCCTSYDHTFYRDRIEAFLPDHIVDIHSHVWFENRSKKRDQNARGASWPSRVAQSNPVEDHQRCYEILFPGKQVTPLVFGNAGREAELAPMNSYVSENAARMSWPALLFTTPRWSAAELERRVAEGGFLGIKPYLSMSDPSIPRKDIRIFDFLPRHHLEVADRHGWIVILHIPRDDRLRDPLNLEDLVAIDRDYPNAQVIVAHVGRAYCEHDVGNAFDILSKTNHLLFDFSANCNTVVIEQLLRAVGPHRVLFGSDLPIMRMRSRRICENGRYINIVPKGLYGDVSADPNMREVEGEEIKRLTFFLYEEIAACLQAADRIGLSAHDVRSIFFDNAKKLIEDAKEKTK